MNEELNQEPSQDQGPAGFDDETGPAAAADDDANDGQPDGSQPADQGQPEASAPPTEAPAPDKPPLDLAAVPGEPAGYQIVGLPQGWAEIKPLADRFRAAAHQIGLSQGQFNQITEAFNGYVAELDGQRQGLADEYQAQQEAQIRARWGLKAGDKDGLRNLMERAAKGYRAAASGMGRDGQDVLELLREYGADGEPEVVALGLRLAELTQEDAGPGGAGPAGASQAMDIESYLKAQGFKD